MFCFRIKQKLQFSFKEEGLFIISKTQVIAVWLQNLTMTEWLTDAGCDFSV